MCCLLRGSATGTAGYVDAVGSAARFNFPTGIAYDGTGNLLITDNQNHCIRVVSLGSNSVSTYAGTNTAGFTDGTATAARFNNPASIIYDAAGVFYVMEQVNHAIRRVAPAAPTVTSFAPTSAYPMQVVTITGTNFAGTTQVQFGGINAAWFSVVSATQINAVVPFGGASGNVSVVAPGGTASLAGFTLAAVPQVSTFVGDGTVGSLDAAGQAARLNLATGVCSDGAGNLFVADYLNQ